MDLGENPQLAVLVVLETALVTARDALIAAHPECCDEEASPGCCTPSEEEGAYAIALMIQIDALKNTVQCYRQSIQRRQDRAWIRRQASSENNSI